MKISCIALSRMVNSLVSFLYLTSPNLSIQENVIREIIVVKVRGNEYLGKCDSGQHCSALGTRHESSQPEKVMIQLSALAKCQMALLIPDNRSRVLVAIFNSVVKNAPCYYPGSVTPPTAGPAQLVRSLKPLTVCSFSVPVKSRDLDEVAATPTLSRKETLPRAPGIMTRPRRATRLERAQNLLVRISFIP